MHSFRRRRLLVAAAAAVLCLDYAAAQSPGCPPISFDTAKIAAACRLATVCTTCVTELGGQLTPQIAAWVQGNPSVATITEAR